MCRLFLFLFIHLFTNPILNRGRGWGHVAAEFILDYNCDSVKEKTI
jgi:hypothetical protein